jgi:hypothetical protein
MLLAMASRGRRAPVADRDGDTAGRSPELAWLEAHRAELEQGYPGEWIAVDADRVIAHASDLTTLLVFAGAAGHLDPLITSVPDGPIGRLYV